MDATAPAQQVPLQQRQARPEEHDVQPCPGCGHAMPALKGARLSICPVCGYKESCCY